MQLKRYVLMYLLYNGLVSY